ncbi:hypothetical protein BGZ57DRAFT_906954 [Hyaloscypha finlandica]|nr:hypothetical protein BGZ57DRAFT_906954 [Hyaloscypha finlandica]
MPIMPYPSAELGDHLGSVKTSEYTIGQAICNLPPGLPPRVCIGARSAGLALRVVSKTRTASRVCTVHSNLTALDIPASSAPSSLFRSISLSRLSQAAFAISLGIAWSFVTIATMLVAGFDGSFARTSLFVSNSDRLTTSVVNRKLATMNYLNSRG